MWPQDCEIVAVLKWDEPLYQKALSWIKEGQEVVFFSKKQKSSHHPHVRIEYVQDSEDLCAKAKDFAQRACLKKLHVHGEGPLEEMLRHLHLAVDGMISDASDFWVQILSNARANRAPHYRGKDLQHAFCGIPAVIVGAGPSLKKSQELLQKLSERALIFAGGTALHLVEVEPHFSASLDPIAPPHKQFPGVPFFYQSRMNKENFSSILGPKIRFAESHCEALNWIDEEEACFDSGWTVGTFLTSVAIWMGCSPIFFLGMDLCYENGKKYAKLDVPSNEGALWARGAFTQKDWLMAAHWIEALEKEMYNLGSGILRLKKLDKEKAFEMCPLQRDLKGKINQKLRSLPVQHEGRVKEWESSLRRCREKISEEEIVYQKLLLPLWKIWEPIFQREHQDLRLHQHLFFQRVLEEHEASLLSK